MTRWQVWMERWRIRRCIADVNSKMLRYERKYLLTPFLDQDPLYKSMKTYRDQLEQQLDRTIYKPKTKQ